MYIIIAGAGVVGFHIASLLVEGKHEVTVIEPSEDIIDGVRRQLDVKTVLGNAATPKVLRDAEISRADLTIAVTNNDETNMLICFLAKELGAAMTMARVRNPEYSGYFITAAKSPSAPRKVIRPKSLGIDLFINPEVEAAEEVMNVLASLYPTPTESFADDRVQIREFRVGEGAMASKPLQNIPFPAPCVVAAIVRSGKTIPTNPDEIIEEGDHLYLIASRESMGKFGDMFAQPQRQVQSAVIFGGDRIGLLLAEGLQKRGVSVKVIEKNLTRCQEIAAQLQQAVVVQGDATDRDFLIEQGVPSADAFVSTSASDELNILCALSAKNLGVSRSLIVLNDPGYIRLAEAIGIDVAISPLLLTAGRITHFVLHGGAISATFVGGKELQAIEFVTGSAASIVDKKISEAGLPKEAIVGAIIRNDTVIIPPNDSVIQSGDHIIIISPLSATPSVERLFK